MASPDPNRLSASSTESRREFLVTKLGAAFALAAYPAAGQAIKTDASGLTAGDVKIPVADGMIPAYRACPSSRGNFPIVLIVGEMLAVSEQTKDVCRRFAKAGYCALAPSLVREGDVKTQLVPTGTEGEMGASLDYKVPDARVMTDLDASIDWAVRNQRVSATRVAVVGFGGGGRIAWLYSALSSRIKAGIVFYGPLEGVKTPLTPKQPLDYAGGIKIPVLGFYGGKDAQIPHESLEKMKLSLDLVNSPADLVIYPNAQHLFFADDSSNYSKADAEDAWKKTLAFLKLGGV